MIERPTARYGRRRLTRRQRRLIAGALTALVLVAGVTVAIVAFGRFGSPVEGELSSYRLVDDETVEVTVSVTRENPAEPVVCIVRARSIDGGETGRREVLVAPSTQHTVQVTTLVKSSRPPVVGDVYGCGTDVPPYLVAP
ncbi:hypothetical protein BST36_27925 [Mycolicibacterium moriokaense]|jgi:hypothetical protein|uniref:Membrane protein n=1 Tax=Mycolicibacterium moriokaense TaxID=39691 RepID=A0AAD1H8L6_9MYCO|nr:DUF4307 domain-containing protein [Mycolicibacterium moriokaense]MCV7041301.1 DUF4307 domain-containing protein [Mycolicibacterium moriokaense]ORB14945.1 hypothetical protein BST36_27925 [Mycolicibacterium moriokaense]BBX00868.1 membrane protein [Mycolicibacterium moriokaense]